MTTSIIIALALISIFLSAIYMRNRKVSTNIKCHNEKQLKTIRELNITNELSASLLSSLDMESAVDILLDRSRELLKATRSAVILTNKNGGIEGFFTSLGPSSGCKAKLTGILRKVYEDMVPARGDDIPSMPGFDGLPDNHPDISGIIVVPIILRGEIIGELMVTDKNNGKDFTSEDEDLLLTIAFYLGLTIEKVNLHDEIVKMASTDGLTGLHNHRMLQERLENEIDRVKRYKRPFSLMMIDIDHFKNFNDKFGHQTGDEVLKLISAIMTKNMRSIDMAARYGGEEFAVILSETPLSGALQIAERIREQIKDNKIELKGEEVTITVSIGIAEFPEDGSTREGLIGAADKALYLAKRSGRNRVCTYR
ncbi:MAG TPA: sensor domain-containing diguanylate cyclase [Nitrospirae bacterium]|nr:response regulator PleD [bacterium BMS3Abin07]HDL20714.1 sensor domain-containing diguanylate cyclase [Nitrospirota bacterium]HDO23567.1 sensor domain-containing diguanylate cyclase [Nitrospirota bacterium]HDZ83769.1 sensor domain-containing diguanylate cyclase [Nitrospirota bacterium]